MGIPASYTRQLSPCIWGLRFVLFSPTLELNAHQNPNWVTDPEEPPNTLQGSDHQVHVRIIHVSFINWDLQIHVRVTQAPEPGETIRERAPNSGVPRTENRVKIPPKRVLGEILIDFHGIPPTKKPVCVSTGLPWTAGKTIK